MKNIKSQGNGEQPAISRRHFIQASSALIALPFVSSPATAQARAVTATENRPAEKVVQTCSTFDCGGKCDIRAHVSDGIVTRISTRPDNALDAQMPVMRACVRGRAYRKFVYHPDRLKYPMKRVGKRGEGKFERISWDEATTLIADNLKSITEKYGPASRYVHVGTAVSGGTFSGDKMARRLLNLTGGYLESYHSVSMGNTAAATPYTYGTAASGSSLDTLLETKLVILWGHNPTETIFGHTNYFLQKMKQNGTRFIVVDPRYSDTVSSLAKDFPLQLITWKGKNRANSTQYANPWLIEVQQQTLWINPQDAQKRGITHGDMVRIHNSRGICEIPAEVTPRIIPGVVAMQAGAWWQPDENGVDKGGCANVLSSARITALAKGNSHQTMLVEVAKA